MFACLSPTGISLSDHLGIATKLIDRACDLSPEGEIELTAGWIRHRYSANWKMLPENDTDGYHLTFTHASFMKAVNSQYNLFAGNEKDVRAVLRDWGNGHTEIDWAPGYTSVRLTGLVVVRKESLLAISPRWSNATAKMRRNNARSMARRMRSFSPIFSSPR